MKNSRIDCIVVDLLRKRVISSERKRCGLLWTCMGRDTDFAVGALAPNREIFHPKLTKGYILFSID